MLELAVVIVSIGSVLINYYLIKNFKVHVEITHNTEPKVFVKVLEKPVQETPTQAPLTNNDESRHAWKNGKIETEPVKVGWRPANNPPPPPGPMERPSGFSR